MSDSTFNYAFILIFALAFIMNGYVVYKIANTKTVFTRHVVILKPEQKPNPTCFCSLDDDAWKEIKAETIS